MKIIEPKYEILTDISEGGIKELQQIVSATRARIRSRRMVSRRRSWWAFW